MSMDCAARKQFTLRLPGGTLELGPRTLLMGILNVTPDSFSDGGRFADPGRAVERAWQIREQGADILDVGGESTRPGSQPVCADEELRRVVPVLDALAHGFPLPISIDTYRPEVAHAALERGVSLVNDIRALRSDTRNAEYAARYGAALVLMHMRGDPQNMHLLARSPDILSELDLWAKEAVARARNCGVSSEKIILDPGIGFGKSVRQNLEILRNLDRLAALGHPLLVGTSRKSFIGQILNNPEADRIWGTGATVAASIIFGAHIVRVHDVGPMRDIARVTDALVAERIAV